MSELADALYRALTGGSGRKPSFGEMIDNLPQWRASLGMSRRAMSRQYGIPETTLRRWEKGARPTPRDYERQYGKLLGMHRALVINERVAARWDRNDIVVTIDGFPTKGGSGRTETRTLDARQLDLAPGTGEKVVAAFLAGDDERAARRFVAGIQDDFYHGVVFGGWLGHQGSDDDDNGDLAYEGHHDVDSDYQLAVSAS